MVRPAYNDGMAVRFASFMDLCHLKACGTCEATPEVHWRSRAAGVQCQGRQKDTKQHLQSKKGASALLLRSLEKECPQVLIRLSPIRKPKNWDAIDQPVVPLERDQDGHPLAGLHWRGRLD